MYCCYKKAIHKSFISLGTKIFFLFLYPYFFHQEKKGSNFTDLPIRLIFPSTFCNVNQKKLFQSCYMHEKLLNSLKSLFHLHLFLRHNNTIDVKNSSKLNIITFYFDGESLSSCQKLQFDFAISYLHGTYILSLLSKDHQWSLSTGGAHATSL